MLVKGMKELSAIAYKALIGVMTRANTPPAPFGNKATPPVPEPPPIPGTRRFLLAVETTLKDPAHAAEFNAWCNDVHIPDDLSCPGYRAAVLLDRVAGGGAPGRAQNLTFFESTRTIAPRPSPCATSGGSARSCSGPTTAAACMSARGRRPTTS